MISQKGLIGLITVTTVVLVGAFVATQNQQRIEPRDKAAGTAFVPTLAARINDVEQIKITAGEQTIPLERKATGWVLTNKDDYPADLTKIRQLLIGLSQLTVVESKTNNPDNYEKLGTKDPGAGVTSTLIEVLAKGGGSLVSVIVGNQAPARTGSGRNEYYMRKKGEAQNFLVEGNLVVGKSTADWIDKQLTNIDNKRIAEVTVAHNDGTRITVKKDRPDQTDFIAVEPKNHAGTKSQFALNNVGTTLAHLTIQDVAKAESMDLGKPDMDATLKTFDGLVITAQFAKKDNKTYTKLRVSHDASLSSPPADVSTPKDDGKQTNTNATPADPATVQKEAADLTTRLSPWLFEIPSYQAESLGKRPVDLFEPAAAPTKK